MAGVDREEQISPAIRSALTVEYSDGLHYKVDVERCYVFSRAGELLLAKEGTQREVVFLPHELEMMQRDGNCVLTHNHPRGTSFSPEDVDLTVRANLSELRAVGIDSFGKVWEYWLIRPARGWPSRAEWTGAWNPAHRSEQQRLQRAVKRGSMSVEYAGTYLLHLVWLRVAQQLHLTYRRRAIDDEVHA